MTDLGVRDEAFFSQHMSDEDIVLSNVHRDLFSDLWKVLRNDLPDGRYKSMVKTELEMAAMLATKALSHKIIEG
jgi:protein gp37